MPIDRRALFDIAVLACGPGGGDREGHEATRVLFDEGEPGGESIGEDGLRFDDVVGGQDGEDRIRISFCENGGGEANGIQGVSAARFAEYMIIGDAGNHRVDLITKSFSGADPPLAVADHAGESIACKAKQAFFFDERDELLRAIRPAQWPESGAGSTSHDHCVSHGSA
jgi:hypothetical protein